MINPNKYNFLVYVETGTSTTAAWVDFDIGALTATRTWKVSLLTLVN